MDSVLLSNMEYERDVIIYTDHGDHDDINVKTEHNIAIHDTDHLNPIQVKKINLHTVQSIWVKP